MSTNKLCDLEVSIREDPYCRPLNEGPLTLKATLAHAHVTYKQSPHITRHN